MTPFPNFGPDAAGAGQKNRGAAEACPEKENAMLDTIQQIERPAKTECAERASGGEHDTPAMKFRGIWTMTPVQWADVPDNPRQRNTEWRAARAAHLKLPHPTHAKLNMARLPNGALYKLDGHTRSFLWQTGKLSAPATLHVDVWDCSDLDAVRNLYGTFDSKAAVETTIDLIHGGMRDLDLNFQSDLLRSHRFVAGMRLAHSLVFGDASASVATPYDLLKEWRPELNQLDVCDPTRRRFNSGVAAAALLTIRRYGIDACKFWNAYAHGGGTKLDGQMDPVQALEERMNRRRGQKKTTGTANAYENTRIALSAYLRDRGGESYSVDGSGIKALQVGTMQDLLRIVRKISRPSCVIAE